MKKLIEIEINFPNDFRPPDKFRGDTSSTKNTCSYCPFFEWDDETGEGSCVVNGYEECPIRKYFDK